MNRDVGSAVIVEMNKFTFTHLNRNFGNFFLQMLFKTTLFFEMLFPTPHDTFIKRIFSNKEDSISFFQSTLPSEVLAILAIENLEQTKESFVPKNQNSTQTYILWKIPTKTGKEIFTYLLFEHKSYHDPKIFFQLLGYITQIYLWQKDNGKELTPVIPFVFYHGEKDWNLGLGFTDQFR